MERHEMNDKIGQMRATTDRALSVTDVQRKQADLFNRNTSLWFRIRKADDEDVWLHMNGETWTTDKRYLYLGTKSRMETLAQRSPALANEDDWIAVEVTNEVRGRKIFVPSRNSP